MKKLLTTILLFGLITGLFAQDENNLKNFRFGLVATPSMNWYKPDDVKKLEKGGVKVGFAWGLQMEFRLNSVACLVTGLQLDYDRGYLKFLDSTFFFYDTKESTYLLPSDTAGKSWVVYKLNERIYKTNYVNLPLILKMKTKEIGYLTYFGQFGINAGFRLKAKSNDEVTQMTTNFPKSSLSDIDNTRDMNMLRMSLCIGGGAEYNLSGSTSLLFGVNFNYGFTNVLDKESDYLLRTDATATKQVAFGRGIGLTVGILF